jgi:hypothetical protein
VTIDEKTPLTLSVPAAGHLLGIGRDAAYAAAQRGEIPVLHLGRSLRVPLPKLLELLGLPQADRQSLPAPSQGSPHDLEPTAAIIAGTESSNIPASSAIWS